MTFLIIQLYNALLSNNTALSNELVSLLSLFFFVIYLFWYKTLKILYLYSFFNKNTQNKQKAMQLIRIAFCL